jgi:MFS family permease
MEILKLKNPHLTKIVLVLTGMMTVMAGALIAPTLPSIQSYFSSVPSIELITPLVLTVVSLACIIFAPVIGYLLDRISKRKIFLTSLLLFAASGSAGLYLNSVWAIVASRVILGLAVAGISACTLTLVGDYFEGS